MYCSNCGKKIKSGAKFCSSCGESFSEKKSSAKEIPTSQVIVINNEEKRKEEERKQKLRKQSNSCAIIFFILFIIPALAYFVIESPTTSDWEAIFYSILGFAIIVMIVVILAKLSGKIKALIAKKPIFILVFVVIFLAILGGVYLSYRSYKYSVIEEKTTFIQDKVTEIAAAKLLGDTFMVAGNTPVGGVTLQNVNDAASAEKTRLVEVSYPKELMGYVNSVSAWADKIAGAKDYNTWGTISDEPEKFEILISNSWIKGLFGKSLNDLAALKDLGEDALKNQDREKLRFIAARLITLDHFYSSIETYQAVADGGFIEVAHAAGAAKIFTRSICYPAGGKTICLADAHQTVGKAKPIIQKGYTVGPAAPESTTGDWNNAFSGIGDGLDNLGVPLGGAGVGQGEPITEPQFSPRVQAFRNSCRARGGNPDPTTSVKERLPTTEGGYTCQIGGCWEFLTSSTGRFYSGGNPGCPEVGLVPRPNPWNQLQNQVNNLNNNNNQNNNNQNNNQNDDKPTSYDGTYSVRYSYGNCGTNIPGTNLGNLGVFNDTITVRNNVVTFGGYTARIDSSGRAVWSQNLGVGTIQQTFNFTKNGVSGTFSFRVSTQGVGVACNGSFTGAKR